MPARVLIAVDNQECSASAVESVKCRLWEPETKFLLVKVVEDFKTLLNTEQIEHAEVLQSEQQEYTYEMRMWLNELTASFSLIFPETVSRLEIGNVPSLICEIAYEWCADYIVLGSHDREMSNRCALGSVATAVVRGAPCSVESVRYRELRKLLLQEGQVGDDQIRAIVTAPRKILLATDRSPASESAIDWVASIDWPAGSVIKLVTVTSPQHKDEKSHWFKGVGTLFTQESQHQKIVETEFKVQAARLADLKSAALETQIIDHESPADAIFEIANTWGAELVVMGASGEGHSSETRVGSTTVSVLDGLHCSLIIIQSDSQRQVHFSWPS